MAQPTTKKITEAAPVTPVLARASESGDAAVQYLIAQRQSHIMSGDDVSAAAVTAQLSEMGYA